MVWMLPSDAVRGGMVRRVDEGRGDGVARPGRAPSGRRRCAAGAGRPPPGDARRARVDHLRDARGEPRAACASAIALEACRSIRTCSVSMPRSTRNAAKGAIMPPVSISVSRTPAMQLGAPDDRARQHVGVAADPLGGRLDHEVGAQLHGPAQVGRGERVVDDDRGAVPVGPSRRGRDRSATTMVGLAMVSRYSTRAGRSSAASTASSSVASTYSTSTPNRAEHVTSAASGCCRRRARVATTRSPARSCDTSAAWMAAMPRREREAGLGARGAPRTRRPARPPWGCPSGRRRSPGRRSARMSPSSAASSASNVTDW